MIRLSYPQTSQLLDQPETGMGYQNIRADLRDSLAPRRGTVLNAELLIWETEAPRLLSTQYESLLRQASSADATKIRSLEVLAPSKQPAGFVAERSAADGELGPATDGEPETLPAGEVFARFTAYRNDRRITPGNGLLPGSYATTEEDGKRVETGSEAVERYALPDPTPAIFKFRIEPGEGTELRRGIVQPAYGHSGGGVEVLFDDGTGDDTVSGPEELPP